MSVDDIVRGLHAINDGEDKTCLDGQGLEPVDLYGYARQDAARVLIQSWTDGLRDGALLPAMIHDVEDTVAELRAFERAVRFRFSDHFAMGRTADTSTVREPQPGV